MKYILESLQKAEFGRSGVYKIMETFDKHGNVETKPGKGRKAKMSKDQIHEGLNSTKMSPS